MKAVNPQLFFRENDPLNLKTGAKAGIDREALRALVADADLLGRDAYGWSWLLIRTTPELLEFLATLDGGGEDIEDGDPDEDGTEDACVEDVIVEQARYGTPEAITPPYNEDDEPDDEDTDEGEEWALNPKLRAKAVFDLSVDCDAEPDDDKEPSAWGNPQ